VQLTIPERPVICHEGTLARSIQGLAKNLSPVSSSKLCSKR
jgi:hypothetical protein